MNQNRLLDVLDEIQRLVRRIDGSIKCSTEEFQMFDLSEGRDEIMYDGTICISILQSQ